MTVNLDPAKNFIGESQFQRINLVLQVPFLELEKSEFQSRFRSKQGPNPIQTESAPDFQILLILVRPGPGFLIFSVQVRTELLGPGQIRFGPFSDRVALQCLKLFGPWIPTFELHVY